MSRSSRHKGKHGQMSRDQQYEGTAARTRPFSFDEIMSKRINKKVSENEKGELKGVSEAVIHEKASERRSERGDGHNEESCLRQHLSEERSKASYRKKEDQVSMKDDYIAKGKDRDVRDSETKSKVKMNEDLRTGVKEKTNEKVNDRRKSDRWLSSISENQVVKKHSRDVEKDRHVDKSRGKSERESNAKYRNGVDDKSRERNAAKKYDLGKGHHLESSERKERKEFSKYHNEELRLKRRRSRSREREDRNRRSISLSPRAHKHGSYHKREQGESSSHPVKERSGRQQSDADKSKITNSSSGSHHRRHGGFASGLGGYSPRKRKTEAAIKTPSPAKRSPEKKSARWDLAPKGTNNVFPAVILSNFQSPKQTASSNIHRVVSAVPVASAAMKPLSGVSPSALATATKISTESIQLTQATRPMRRLYMENIPASASEKAVMQCLNNLLISSGVNHIQGTQPCISCIMHKEKGQALVEFLTPEDASAALSFDGCSFSGSIIKVRRPKDFVEVAAFKKTKLNATMDGQFKMSRPNNIRLTKKEEVPDTGELEKSAAAFEAIDDVVKDSCHKIFIGGISKAVSSKMFMEIASAFGPLKAYQFENSKDPDEPFAFLEYADQSVTFKACAGLNGMKLGGQVITAIQAVPDASSSGSDENPPFCQIPQQAKALLEKPTEVLKLKNVFDSENLSSLSTTEVEEVLEDVRLECVRFGSVKSVNVVKSGATATSTSKLCECNDDMASAEATQSLGCDVTNPKTRNNRESIDQKVMEGNSIGDDKPANYVMEEEPCQPGQVDSDTVVQDSEVPPLDELDSSVDKFTDDIEMEEARAENKSTAGEDLNLEDDSGNKLTAREELNLEEVGERKSMTREKLNLEEVRKNKVMAEEELDWEEASGDVEKAFVNDSMEARPNTIEKGDDEEQDSDLGCIFEPGCVFVEFRRTEASCMAAHCLHGRLFDGRVVVVEYVPLDIYLARFPK
ncbi:unnamed protein product [Dovyalis caffra]|uniref:RRM domain-containing protein n=1 Tax=Dovyalis caffra TaxID=77055 RepID=A0AAV1QZW7_9ROSI|nr:unnamed protein product [Dovyalis caffra]